MRNALVESLQSEPIHLRKSITFDNGTENTLHASVNQALGTLSFFVNLTIPGPGEKALSSSLLALSGASILKKLTGTWSLNKILILSRISSIIVQENVLTFYRLLRLTPLHLLLECGKMNIHLSLKKPLDATASVFYRGMWFYLKDSDSDSKETLSLLEQLFSLQAGNLAGNPPSLTIPV